VCGGRLRLREAIIRRHSRELLKGRRREIAWRPSGVEFGLRVVFGESMGHEGKNIVEEGKLWEKRKTLITKRTAAFLYGDRRTSPAKALTGAPGGAQKATHCKRKQGDKKKHNMKSFLGEGSEKPGIYLKTQTSRLEKRRKRNNRGKRRDQKKKQYDGESQRAGCPS